METLPTTNVFLIWTNYWSGSVFGVTVPLAACSIRGGGRGFDWRSLRSNPSWAPTFVNTVPPGSHEPPLLASPRVIASFTQERALNETLREDLSVH